MLDDTLLADPVRLAQADARGVLRTVAGAGAQVRATAGAAVEARIDRLAGVRPRALVLLTPPGPAAWAARITAALLGPSCPVPVVLAEVTPGWLGPLDVVVAHGGDPADDVLAGAVDAAARRGAEVVLSSGDGPVAAAGAGRVRLLPARSAPLEPGFDLPRALTAALAVTAALGLLRVDVELLADELDREAERNHPRHEPFVNPGKTLALRLAERVPLLWGIDPPAAEVAGYGAAALAARAGVVAHAASLATAGTLPALQQAAARGASAEALFADPFADGTGHEAPEPRVVLLAVRDDDPTRTRLSQATRSWPGADLLHPVEEIAGDDTVRTAVLTTRLDFAACYLGLATGAAVTPLAGLA